MRGIAVAMAVALVSLSFAMITSGDHQGALPAPEHPADACSPPFHVQGAGWDLCWQQDDVRGQGIELNQVYFHGESMLAKIGFPFSITKYENDRYGPFKDTLGASLSEGNPGFGRGSMVLGADQCPRFLAVGVLLNDQRLCVEGRDGPEPALAVWGRYDIFNYRFLQGYILDARGTIEPFVRLGGLLIDGDPIGSAGTNHFHHLYWRADFDIGIPSEDTFQMYVRPDAAWNDWEPYIVWTPGDGNTSNDGLRIPCAAFPADRMPPPCNIGDPEGEFTPVDPLADLPDACRQQVHSGLAGWCSVAAEAALSHHPALFTKWRIADHHDVNLWGSPKSFESSGHSHHGVTPDGEFTSFDAMVVEYQGPSDQIGFEVPPVPKAGDAYLGAYKDPPQALLDPVLWFAVHAYHDTRDEEQPTMTYHHVSFLIEPRDFLHSNYGEDTYAAKQGIPNPGDIIEDPCVGPVCVG